MDTLPKYDEPKLPMYSPLIAHPSGSSSTMSNNPPSAGRNFNATSEFDYKSEYLLVSLGSRKWGTRIPVYGFHGVVDGKTKLRKRCTSVIRMTVTLNGVASLTIADHYGRLSAFTKTKILSQSEVLIDSKSEGCTIPEGREFPFSIAFPTYVSGGHSSLPPSYTANIRGAVCDINYTLSVDVVRKGLHRHERILIPIFYLPQSRPLQPPLFCLSPGYDIDDSTDDYRADTIQFPFSHAAQNRTSAGFVQFAMPSPKCFVAGEFIPLTVKIISREAPVLPRLLTNDESITIRLVKRIKISIDSKWDLKEIILSSADLQHVEHHIEGESASYWALQVGKSQQHASWTLPGVMSISFVIRISVTPRQNGMQTSVAWGHDEPVQIVSDAWADPALIEEILDQPALGFANSHIRMGDQM